jgi:hypothetical protein
MRSNLAQKRDKGPAGLDVSVVERKDEPGVWTVEAIDMANDGEIYQALFVGLDAEKRAREYARFKYGTQ